MRRVAALWACAALAFSMLLAACGGTPGAATRDSKAVEAQQSAPDLIDLAVACQGSDYAACDDLEAEAPEGSNLHDYGWSCGGRSRGQALCADQSSLDDGDFGPIPVEDYAMDTRCAIGDAEGAWCEDAGPARHSQNGNGGDWTTDGTSGDYNDNGGDWTTDGTSGDYNDNGGDWTTDGTSGDYNDNGGDWNYGGSAENYSGNGGDWSTGGSTGGYSGGNGGDWSVGN